MGYACNFFARKLAAFLLVFGLLVASLCAIRCAAHACVGSPSAGNKTEVCHHQASHHSFAGIDTPYIPVSCHPSDLVFDLPSLEVRPASSPEALRGAMYDLAAQSRDAEASAWLDAGPPGLGVLLLSPTGLESRLSSPLRI